MNESSTKLPRLNVMLTCDVEALPSEAAEDHVERLIWGRFPEAPREAGIGLMMDIADEFGVKITFFLDVIEQDRYGAEIDRVARSILERGHDLQLHLHIEFLQEEFWTRLGYLKPTWAMNYYNDETARLVVEYGVDKFVKMAGYLPCAYRAGAFRYNQSILKAVGEAGMKISSQYYPATTLKPSFPHGFDAGILPVFRWSNGLIEVPVGCIEHPHPRKLKPRYRGFESHRLEDLKDIQAFMARFWSYGPDYEVMVLVMHSWAFLGKDSANHFQWKSSHAAELFREFLAQMPSNIHVISARDLLKEIEYQEITPKFEMPLAVAGTEAIPLYRKPAVQPVAAPIAVPASAPPSPSPVPTTPSPVDGAAAAVHKPTPATLRPTYNQDSAEMPGLKSILKKAAGLFRSADREPGKKPPDGPQ